MKRNAKQAFPANYQAAMARKRSRVVATKSVSTAWQPTGAEIKAIDIATNSYLFRVPATASNIILLNGVQTGTGFFNRVGSRVEMKNLHIRGLCYNNLTSTTGNLRLLIIYDRQPTGALPVISDILQSRDQTGTASTAVNSEINLDNRCVLLCSREGMASCFFG